MVIGTRTIYSLYPGISIVFSFFFDLNWVGTNIEVTEFGIDDVDGRSDDVDGSVANGDVVSGSVANGDVVSGALGGSVANGDVVSGAVVGTVSNSEGCTGRTPILNNNKSKVYLLVIIFASFV